jgi:hypothetical protein
MGKPNDAITKCACAAYQISRKRKQMGEEVCIAKVLNTGLNAMKAPLF